MNISTACMYSSPGNIRILWEITNRCNANCQHCCNDSAINKDSINELSQKRLTELFEEAKMFGVNQMYLTGGEPLLRDDFFNILYEARIRFKKTIISSNGYYIDRNVAMEFKRVKPDYVMLSLDSTSASLHDQNRRLIGLHDKVCAAINILSSVLVPVRVNITITQFNYKELDKLAYLSKELGAEMVLFSTFVPVGRGSNQINLFLDDSQIKEIEIEIEKIKKQNIGLEIKYKRTKQMGTALEECPGADSYFYITSDGRISPCPWICRLDEEYISTNTLKENSFVDVVNSHSVQKFREFIKSRNLNHNCNPCSITNCGHGCPALAKIYDHKYSGFDPYCWEYIK